MRKTLCAIVFACLSTLYIHAEKPVFGWNNAAEGSIGYWKIHSSFGGDSFGTSMPTDLVGLDVNLMGVYFGGGYMVKKTGYEVYGFDERVETFLFKVGPSWRFWWEYDECKLVMAPFLLWGICSVDDESNNTIGQRQDYGPKKNVFGAGLKLTFAYKNFEIGVSGSNRDWGVTVGINFDFD